MEEIIKNAYLQRDAAIIAYEKILKDKNSGLLKRIADLNVRCKEKEKMLVNVQEQRNIFKTEFIPDVMGTLQKVGTSYAKVKTLIDGHDMGDATSQEVRSATLDKKYLSRLNGLLTTYRVMLNKKKQQIQNDLHFKTEK